MPVSNHSSVCLLETAITPVISDGIRINANILFDERAQRSFICSELIRKFQLISDTNIQIAFSSFVANSPLLDIRDQIQTFNSDCISVSILIVPHISMPLQNSCTVKLDKLPHLGRLKIENPISHEPEFSVLILIGADHYWSFVQDHITQGDGPAVQAWLPSLWTLAIANHNNLS